MPGRPSTREALDAQVVSRIVAEVTRTAASAADTYATYRSRLIYAAIDGRYAVSESDLALLMGSETLGDLAQTFRAAENADSALGSIRAAGTGTKVSPHIAAVASSKQDTIIRRGGRDDMAVGLWADVEIIDDPYTGSGKGERELTAVLLAAFKVTRAAGFARVQVQHS